MFLIILNNELPKKAKKKNFSPDFFENSQGSPLSKFLKNSAHKKCDFHIFSGVADSRTKKNYNKTCF